jgi:glycosyltransferase involved in cell wall biosynthesis
MRENRRERPGDAASRETEEISVPDYVVWRFNPAGDSPAEAEGEEEAPGSSTAVADCRFGREGKISMPGAGDMTTLSVIIPTLNEERHVGDLLSDVASQTRMPDEVIVVDAGSVDGTAAVAQRFPFVRLLEGEPPVACGRNFGGRSASGNVLIFLDADIRLPARFLENFLKEFERRHLDVACPLYVPYRSKLAIEGFHALFNLLTRAFQRTLPSGAGHCVASRRDVFRGSRGFDPGLKFDDIELIRRLSKGRRFGIVEERVFVSDRRYREQGTPRMILRYALMALIFALGKFAWANRIEYEFGDHEH